MYSKENNMLKLKMLLFVSLLFSSTFSHAMEFNKEKVVIVSFVISLGIIHRIRASFFNIYNFIHKGFSFFGINYFNEHRIPSASQLIEEQPCPNGEDASKEGIDNGTKENIAQINLERS